MAFQWSRPIASASSSEEAHGKLALRLLAGGASLELRAVPNVEGRYPSVFRDDLAQPCGSHRIMLEDPEADEGCSFKTSTSTLVGLLKQDLIV